MMNRDSAIAIVGMGCRFPGGVNDPDSFWQLLVNQRDAIGLMPPGRFDLTRYHDPTLSEGGKIITDKGGFLDGVDQFDPEFFGISAYEASVMDPQQRLLFEVTWEALEHGGMVPAHLRGSNSGVYVGMWQNDYEDLLYQATDDLDLHVTLGAGRYPAAGRLSHWFDFRGPSLVLDTACSSGLVAVHLACQALRNGETDMALAAGVNVIVQPQISIAYSRVRMLAPDARCKFGDATADGYVRSEGAAVLVLKRLADAERDGDPIRAIIRGSAVNNDGQAGSSLVAPSPIGQLAMLREAYHAAELSPAAIGYIEAHGTGTRIGDPVELEALSAILREGRPAESKCWVGSVKSNIGHTEAVSGLAGLIKAVLCLEHGLIPANLHFKTPNPAIPWADLPVQIPTETVPFPVVDGRRYAGVNSFGVTGTNAHVILEFAPEPAQPSAVALQGGRYVLPLSAHTLQALSALVQAYAALLPTLTDDALVDVLNTAANRRTHHPCRAAFVGDSAGELTQGLAQWQGETQKATPRKTVFVFPGQGGQWVAMGRQLMGQEPVFAGMIDACETAMQPYVDFRLSEVVQSTDEGWLQRIDVVQPVLFAVQVALATVWESKGLNPDAVIGHSMGEVAAAYIAGALTLEDAVKVICLRSRAMRQVSGRGGMLLAEMSLNAAQAALQEYVGRLSVAVNNAPGSVVISGDVAAIESLMADLNTAGVFCRRVNVDVAAHSPHMDALRPELVAALAHMTPMVARLPVYSTVTGALQSGVFDAAYWGRNLREPVLFSTATQAALADGYNTFIEIGPHPVLLPAIERGLPDYLPEAEAQSDVLLIASMRRDEYRVDVIANGLMQFYTNGGTVDWGAWYNGARVVSLPPYPWQRQRYWVDFDPSTVVRVPPAKPQSEDWQQWLYEAQWQPVTLTPQDRDAGHWVILADQAGRGEAIARQLQAQGHQALLVYAVDVRDWGQLVRAIPADARGLIYLWALDATGESVQSNAELSAAQGHVLGNLLELVQGLIADQRRLPLWLVTQGAQQVQGEESRLQPVQGALWGFGRVLREEQPDLWGGLIDLDPAADALDGDWLAALSTSTGEDQLAYRKGQAYALRLRSVAPEIKPYTFRKDGAYLITGGLGDVGGYLAREMVAQGASRLILMGRTALPPRRTWHSLQDDPVLGPKVALVHELESAGASVHLAAVDVADEGALSAWLEAYEAEGWPPVIGVIHAAGALDVGLLQSLNWEAMARVLGPKVLGAWALHRLLPKLDLFVNISSINALLGLPGQANYAAANAFLDSLAMARRAQGQAALSINWSVWQGLGYAATVSGAESSEQLAAQGIGGFPAAVGVKVFGHILSWPQATLTVLPADWTAYQVGRGEGRQFPLLQDVLQGRASDESAASAPMAALLQAAPVDQREALMRELLTDRIARILRLEPAQLKPDMPLGEYGINSLMGMELRNLLERDLGLRLSATLVWNMPTVNLMSAFLLEKLTMPDAPVTARVIPVADVPADPNLDAGLDVAALITDISDLSDDDILNALMNKPE
jgi:acyl transferase domain-containing protein/acyl carrier protein